MLAKEISNEYFKNVNYKELSKDDLIEFIKSLKETYNYSLSADVCIFAIEKYYSDNYLVKHILSILTSCLRQLSLPGKAIYYAEKYINSFNISVALFTSIAAAYCDIKDYENAKKYADIAYAKQGGGVGFNNELSAVYARIKKEAQII